MDVHRKFRQNSGKVRKMQVTYQIKALSKLVNSHGHIEIPEFHKNPEIFQRTSVNHTLKIFIVACRWLAVEEYSFHLFMNSIQTNLVTIIAESYQ